MFGQKKKDASPFGPDVDETEDQQLAVRPTVSKSLLEEEAEQKKKRDRDTEQKQTKKRSSGCGCW